MHQQTFVSTLCTATGIAKGSTQVCDHTQKDHCGLCFFFYTICFSLVLFPHVSVPFLFLLFCCCLNRQKETEVLIVLKEKDLVDCVLLLSRDLFLTGLTDAERKGL